MPSQEPLVRYDQRIESIAQVQSILYKHFDKDFSIKSLTDGITNTLYKCTHKTFTCLVRIYGEGTEQFLDRKNELLYLQKLYSEPMYFHFDNGMCYGYIEGQVMNPESLKLHWPEFITALVQFHSVQVDSNPILFNKMWTFYNLVKETTFTKANLSSIEIKHIIQDLESRITLQDLPIGFCHNDLLPGNIILGNEIKFIDYEYCGCNYVYYDLANHINEYGGLECIGGLDDQEIETLVGLYTQNDNVQTSLTIEKVKMFIPISHLLWCLWALEQYQVSKLEFDFLDYALKRWQGYLNTKS
jgi:ethanolamine kinase